MRKVSILIPALNPPETLVQYVEMLVQEGFGNIIVVNDGSNEKAEEIFEVLEKKKEVHYLKHEVNFGKGRAIKTGLSFFEENCLQAEGNLGIITVDSDGQHLPGDVSKVADEMERENEGLVLGTRNFDFEFVPFKSKLGNKVTSVIFSILNGKYIHDTQTGLRGISRKLIKEYLQLEGERFEYEINMLIYAVQQKHRIKEIEIQTIYIDGNKETHFNPIKDSLKIYKVIFAKFFKYISSSLSSAILDLLMFQAFCLLLGGIENSLKIVLSTIGARIFSSFFNFLVNKKLVFRDKGGCKKQIIQYYLLCVILMVSSAALVILINKILGLSPIIVKIFVDSILFCISFRIQQEVIFNKNE